MRIQNEMSPHFLVLRLIIVSSMIFVQLIATCECVYSQQAPPPIEKEGLLISLRKHALEIDELTNDLKTRGVNFSVTPEIEREIRQAGQYLGAKIDKLIEAARNNDRSLFRLRVSLFNYTPCEQYYDQFAQLLSSKVNRLSDMLQAKGSQCSYTGRLKLVKEERLFDMSLEEANQYLEKSHSLQLLRGTCSSNGKDVTIYSQVFLGDLHGPLGSTITIPFKFDPSDVGKTRDFHSLLILYSLAKDAQAKGLGKEIIIAYLSEALGIVAQIKNLEPETLQSIKSAIEDMLRQVGASNLLVLPAQ
jgi:hypothetical protein